MSGPEPGCYIVNLRRRPDRRTLIEAQLPPELPAQFTSDWETEIDGHLLDHGALEAAGVRLYPLADRLGQPVVEPAPEMG